MLAIPRVILEGMFDNLAEAVAAYRDAATMHRRAARRGEYTEMDAAAEQIRSVCGHLRARRRPDLIFPLTMEWVTLDRDPAEHERYRQLVERLLDS